MPVWGEERLSREPLFLSYLLNAVPVGYEAEPLPPSDGGSRIEAIGSPSKAPGVWLAQAFLEHGVGLLRHL